MSVGDYSILEVRVYRRAFESLIHGHLDREAGMRIYHLLEAGEVEQANSVLFQEVFLQGGDE